MRRRVVSLHYVIEGKGTRAYLAAAPENRFEVGGFRFQVSDQSLKVAVGAGFTDIDKAREEFEREFEPWRMAFELESGLPLEITFSHARQFSEDGKIRPSTNVRISPWSEWVEARTPPAPGTARLAWPPAQGMRIGPLTEKLWGIWTKRPTGLLGFTAAAYKCLNEVETALGTGKGNRRTAADRLSIEFDVLAELGKLTAIHRKAGDRQELAKRERVFIDVAVKRLITRVAEHEAQEMVSGLRRITMAEIEAEVNAQLAD